MAKYPFDNEKDLAIDAEALRAMHAPIKKRYKDSPQAAVITLEAEGKVDNQVIASKVYTGGAIVTAGLLRRPVAAG